MKAITLILMFSLLTLGCQKSDSSKETPTDDSGKPTVSQEETPKDETTNEGYSYPPPDDIKPTNKPKDLDSKPTGQKSGGQVISKKGNQSANGNGGGIDSSGGNLILSTDNQAIEVSAALPKRIFLALLRLEMQVRSTEKLRFEKMHGEGSFKLARDFVDAKAKNGMGVLELFKKEMVNFNFPPDSCQGDHMDRDGSASWGSERALICLSRVGLQKLSPESIAKDALALGIHEAAHLVGLNEEQAEAVQRFALKNMGLLAPHEGQLKEYLEMTDRLLVGFLDVAAGFRENNTVRVCPILSSMKTIAVSLFKEFKAGDSLIMPSLVVGDHFAPIILIDISTACQKNDLKEVRRLFSEHIGSIYSQIAQLRGYGNLIVDGNEKLTLLDTYGYLNLGENFEEGLMKSRSGPKLRFEDFTCRFKSKSFEQDLRGRTHYQNKDGELGTIDFSIGGESKFIMLRRMKGQLGFGFGIMSAKLKVTNPIGLEGTDGGNKTLVFATHVVPGVKHRIQFDAEDSGDSYKIVCDWKRPGESLDLQYQEKQKKSVKSDDDELEHFSMKPANLSLQIRLIKKEDSRIVETLNFEKVETLEYNGYIILHTDQGDRCIIPTEAFERKKVDRLKLAKEIRDGKYTKVVCDMVGSRNSQGEVGHAAWAMDFKVN